VTYAWRIDALDPLGGLSFVSWRLETLANDDERLEDAPAFFIGPPNFVPEPIANRGVSLAAGRYGFQIGLFDEEGEVEFESLPIVVDFVRRLYLTGSRGDPTPDGTLPPPSPDTPPFSGGGEETGIEQSSLMDAVSSFDEVSVGLARGQQKPFSWLKFLQRDTKFVLKRYNMQLERGAYILLEEVISRFPQSYQVEQLEGWFRASNGLLEVLSRLELSQVLSSLQSSDSRARDSLYRRINYWPPFATTGSSHHTPVDILRSIPVPRSIASDLAIPNPEYASLAHVLSIFLGDPTVLGRNPDVEALAIFGAARIAVVDLESLFFIDSFHTMDQVSELTSSLRRKKLLNATCSWLVKNLPTTVFEPTIEAMIFNNMAISLPPLEPDFPSYET